MTFLLNPYVIGGGGAAVAGDALAYRSSDYAVPGADGSPIPFNAESYDPENVHSLSVNTERLSTPEAILARFAGAYYSDNSGAAGYLMRRNGAVEHGSFYLPPKSGSGPNRKSASSPIISLSANDYMSLAKDGADTVTVAANLTWASLEVIDPAARYAHVRKSTGQTFSGTQTITFDTEVADVGGWFDAGVSQEVLKVLSGVSVVRVGASTGMTTGGTTISSTTKNTASFFGRSLRSQLAGRGQTIWSAPVEVSTGDEFRSRAFFAASDTAQANELTWFAIEEVPSTYARALMGKSGNQGIVGATDTLLTWDTEAYDTASIHNNVTNNAVAVCPPGKTQCRVSFNIGTDATNNGGTVTVEAKKNAAYVPGLPNDTTTYTANTSRFLNATGGWVDCVPGDQFSLRIFCSAGAVVLAGDFTWFAVEFR